MTLTTVSQRAPPFCTAWLTRMLGDGVPGKVLGRRAANPCEMIPQRIRNGHMNLTNVPTSSYRSCFRRRSLRRRGDHEQGDSAGLPGLRNRIGKTSDAGGRPPTRSSVFDVVIGVVETHDRVDVIRCAEGLPVLRRKTSITWPTVPANSISKHCSNESRMDHHRRVGPHNAPGPHTRNAGRPFTPSSTAASTCSAQ